MDLTIIIPVYNEETAIKKVIIDIKKGLENSKIEYEIIVVDDCSKDNTVNILNSIEGIKILRHKTNRGVGAARKTGLLKAQGRYVAMIDGDDTYPPDKFKDLYDTIENKHVHMIIGARQIEAGTVKVLRILAKNLIKSLAEFLVKEKIPDLNSGLRIFDREKAKNYLYLLPDSHSWVSTITLAFLTDGLEVGYMPIEYYKRKGKSTFHPIKDTYNYIMTIIRTVIYFKPLNFFMPLTFICFLIFLYNFLRDCYYFNIQGGTVLMFILTLFIFFIGIISDQFNRVRNEIRQFFENKLN